MKTVMPGSARWGLGALCIVTTVVMVLALHNPALPVLGVGVVGVALSMVLCRTPLREFLRGLGLPTLVALFVFATTCGTVGRIWNVPAELLAPLDRWGTAFVAAATSVLLNNLPAASLLAAGRPHEPFALLVGLNVGPNLFFTGSLAWFLWFRSARTAGYSPDLWQATRLGLLSAPLALAAAVALLP